MSVATISRVQNRLSNKARQANPHHLNRAKAVNVQCALVQRTLSIGFWAINNREANAVDGQKIKSNGIFYFCRVPYP